MSIITTDLVAIDVDAGGDKEAVIGLLAARLADAGRSTDRDGLVAAAMAREAQSATGLPGGIAIPHCRSPYVDEATIGFARLSPARRLRRTRRPRRPRVPDRRAGLRRRRAHEAAVQPRPGVGAQGLRRVAAQRRVRRRDRRPRRGRGQPAPPPRRSRRGHGRRARGRANDAGRSSPSPPAPPASRTPTWPPTRWSPPARRRASTCRSRRRAPRAARRCPPRPSPAPTAVIFATDVGVKDSGRFAGQPVIASGVKRAINEPDKMVAEALAAGDDPNAARVEGVGGGTVVVQPVGIRRSRLGHPHPADPADRRQLHDPVRRRGRSAHRARLPARRVRHRQQARRRHAVARQHHRQHQLADQPAVGRIRPVPRRGAVHPRRPRLLVPGPCAGGLHLVRHRRPARHRTGFHRGRGGGLRRRRLHRRHRRRPDRRLHRAVDQPDRRPAVACAA